MQPQQKRVWLSDEPALRVEQWSNEPALGVEQGSEDSCCAGVNCSSVVSSSRAIWEYRIAMAGSLIMTSNSSTVFV